MHTCVDLVSFVSDWNNNNVGQMELNLMIPILGNMLVLTMVSGFSVHDYSPFKSSVCWETEEVKKPTS